MDNVDATRNNLMQVEQEEEFDILKISTTLFTCSIPHYMPYVPHLPGWPSTNNEEEELEEEEEEEKEEEEEGDEEEEEEISEVSWTESELQENIDEEDREEIDLYQFSEYTAWGSDSGEERDLTVDCNSNTNFQLITLEKLTIVSWTESELQENIDEEDREEIDLDQFSEYTAWGSDSEEERDLTADCNSNTNFQLTALEKLTIEQEDIEEI